MKMHVPNLMKTSAVRGARIAVSCALSIATSMAYAQAGTPLSAAQFGYLKGDVQTFDGAGCQFFLNKDEHKADRPVFAADDYGYQGLVINYLGQDRLLRSATEDPRKPRTVVGDGLTVTVKEGKTRSCGEECAVTYTSLEVRRGSEKVLIPVLSMCGA